MEENTKKTELSYEELNNIANQLSQQNMALRKQVEEMNYVNLFRRLDYLFKVIENANKFDDSFVTSCVNEVVALMTPEENTATE